MLSVEIIEGNSNVLAEVKPLSVKINLSLNIPAHSAVVIVPYEKYDNPQYINILDENGLIFKGVIDEEQTVFSSAGKYNKFLLRSLMCLLLDNEIEPMVIHKATENFLGRKYLQPLSLEFVPGEHILAEPISCELGTTMYQLMENYSKKVFGTSPYLSPEGVFSFSGGVKNEIVEFSENRSKGIKYNSYKEYKRPYQQITVINYMLDNKGYKYKLKNPNIKSYSVPRERYLDCRLESKTPVSYGEDIMKKSFRESLVAEVVCTNQLTRLIGNRAIVDFSDEEFVITEVSYSFGSTGESTKLLLEKYLKG